MSMSSTQKYCTIYLFIYLFICFFFFFLVFFFFFFFFVVVVVLLFFFLFLFFFFFKINVRLIYQWKKPHTFFTKKVKIHHFMLLDDLTSR